MYLPPKQVGRYRMDADLPQLEEHRHATGSRQWYPSIWDEMVDGHKSTFGDSPPVRGPVS